MLVYYSVVAPEPWTLNPELDYKFLLYCILPAACFALSQTIGSAKPLSKLAERIGTVLFFAAFAFFMPGMVVFKSIFVDGYAVSSKDFVLPVFLLALAVSFFYAGRWYIRKFQSTDFEKE
ncbi:hypothetical protein [Roseibium sp.]|uniref:hypothetical protein n=1 Tax=Roseibium sp. TaxID=1936156 RepID=UPI003B50FBA7